MKSTMVLSLLACLELASAAVFAATTFNDLSIAGGVAGNAKEEALAALAGLPEDLTTVEKSDLTFLDNVNGVCNDAETGAFNPAIESATGEELDAAKRGKTKNKVLKLTATILKLEAQTAQGKDVAAKLTAEQKKLDTNIKADEAAAGKASTAVPFDGEIAIS